MVLDRRDGVLGYVVIIYMSLVIPRWFFRAGCYEFIIGMDYPRCPFAFLKLRAGRQCPSFQEVILVLLKLSLPSIINTPLDEEQFSLLYHLIIDVILMVSRKNFIFLTVK